MKYLALCLMLGMLSCAWAAQFTVELATWSLKPTGVWRYTSCAGNPCWKEVSEYGFDCPKGTVSTIPPNAAENAFKGPTKVYCVVQNKQTKERP